MILYWKAIRPVSENYQVFVHLRNGVGQVVAQSDKLNPGDYPTTRWPLDKYVRDAHRFVIPETVITGEEYRLAIGLWSMDDGMRLQARDANGADLGDSIFLETVDF